MDNNKKREWINIATEHLNLRFPIVKLDIISPFNNAKEGTVLLQTFVANKDRTRITLFRKIHVTRSTDNIFEVLKQLEIRFVKEGKLIEDKFIFSEEHSIAEPYEINKKETMKKPFKLPRK